MFFDLLFCYQRNINRDIFEYDFISSIVLGKKECILKYAVFVFSQPLVACWAEKGTVRPFCAIFLRCLSVDVKSLF